jgi:hypothetical protein
VATEAFHPIQGLTTADCERQFRPKIHGLLVLEKLLAGERLDFCVLTSSWLRSWAECIWRYASANAFMDAFAHQKHCHGETPWLSVNWDGWQFADQRQAAANTVAALAMRPAEGGRPLTRAPSGTSAQAAFRPRTFPCACSMGEIRSFAKISAGSEHSEPSSATAVPDRVCAAAQ